MSQPTKRGAIHKFDCLCDITAPKVGLRRATSGELPHVLDFAKQHLSDELAPLAVVQNVIAHNPNSLLLITRLGALVGLWAMLMLNARGIEALLAGDLDPHRPNIAFLASPTEAPAAIYVWVIVCPGTAAEGIHHVAKFLRQPLYRFANLYSKPTTDLGVRINTRRGFVPLTTVQGLYRYVREANRTARPPLAA